MPYLIYHDSHISFELFSTIITSSIKPIDFQYLVRFSGDFEHLHLLFIQSLNLLEL